MTLSISKWVELSDMLKDIKKKEAEIRRELCDAIIGDQPMTNGRVTVKDTLDNHEVKATQTLSYNVDMAVLMTMWQDMSDLERNAIRWKPELKLADYKKLGEDSLLHEAITTKPATPTLEAKLMETYQEEGN